jgi:hypothetical protein
LYYLGIPLSKIKVSLSLASYVKPTHECEVREYIVEAMTHVDTETIQQSFKSIKADTGIGFVTKLDESKHAVLFHRNPITTPSLEIARCRRQVPPLAIPAVTYIIFRTLFDQTGRLTLLRNSLNSSKVILSFLSIMWHSGTRGSLHPQTTSSLLVSLVTQMAVECRGSLPSKILCGPLLVALSVMESQRVDPAFGDVKVIWKDPPIWQAALTAGSSNLIVACGQSRHIRVVVAFAEKTLSSCIRSVPSLFEPDV